MSSSAATLVQYILVRGALMRILNWPLGAVVAQACHASVAATQLFSTHEHTQQYLQDLDHMHKVVLEVRIYGGPYLYRRSIRVPPPTCLVHLGQNLASNKTSLCFSQSGS